jgi:hypothetical protein
VADPNFSFSMQEEVAIQFSHRLLPIGVTDKPESAILMNNQNIQIVYERSPIVSSVQSFVSADLERVLCASMLARHLIPHYINFSMLYRGGSSTDVVLQDILDYLKALSPSSTVDVSDLENLARRRGADYVRNPMELIAIIHNLDRVLTVDRSKDSVSIGKLATFFEGIISVTRELSIV